MGRPRIHDATTAEALLDAAGGLLREGGPTAVSVRAVADASGTTVRAVYALFGSKQALIDALAQRGYRDLARRVRAAPETEDPRADLVAAGVDGFRGFALEDPETFRLVFERISPEVLRLEETGRAAYESYHALESRVRRLRASGAIRDGWSDQACIFAFHAACQGLASCELARRPPPAGPGFWPMMRDVAMVPLWRDALSGLVHGFAAEPTSGGAVRD